VPSAADIVRSAGRGVACPAGCRRAHSYTSSGERWCWRPATAARGAIDVESTAAAPPPHLLRRLGTTEPRFWPTWTRLEVIAKLTDTPVMTLLRTAGPEPAAPEGFHLEHLRIDGHLCCVAWKEEAR